MVDLSSAADSALCSREKVCSHLQAILRAAQTRFTDAQLEQLSGVPARAIKSYRIEGKEPPLSVALSLALVLGEGALNSLLSLVGYVARPLDEAGELNINSLVATSLQHFSTIATAAADGRIDHTEAPLCREAADMIIATVMPLSSAAGAA